VREFVNYLMFVDEKPLASPVRGTSGFAEKFSAEGPQDSKGRSLRDFDLHTRLMKYRCSYMIYSDAFDGMPKAAKDAVYKKMREVLRGFPAEERDAIVSILRETKRDWN
jgi:hypothetical protein